ncbi:MAG: DinB family protein [Verrucomicrobiae bacterium]|nr:DinB family protein [Verrucomicrobiae bacterium]
MSNLSSHSKSDDQPQTEISEGPRLDPPGAGLPPLELAIGRRLFAFTRWRGSRESFDVRIDGEREAIERLVARCSEVERSRPVLIPRPRGLEDSSRNWSVWMTLDHLRITNDVFAMVIKSLAAGRVPQREASTADVKPSAEVSNEVETAFAASCDRLLETVDGVGDLRTKANYAHPWFGPLDASGWHALAAVHLGLHRGQIEKILERLPA